MFNVAVKVEKNKKLAKVAFSGPLNEKVTLDSVDLGPAKDLFIDFGDVESINSAGVHEWMDWVHRLPREVMCHFEKCPYYIVEQMNMIVGFVPDGSVIESFFAPYLCQSCSNQFTVLLKRGKDFKDSGVNAPVAKCSKCGKDAEVDFVPERYFAFLKASIR